MFADGFDGWIYEYVNKRLNNGFCRSSCDVVQVPSFDDVDLFCGFTLTLPLNVFYCPFDNVFFLFLLKFSICFSFVFACIFRCVRLWMWYIVRKMYIGNVWKMKADGRAAFFCLAHGSWVVCYYILFLLLAFQWWHTMHAYI